MSPVERPVTPFLLSCAGPVLSQEEKAFFTEINPFGFILFLRNCETPDQLRQLTASLRACTGRADTPIFVDQEGGRVTRLKPPHWTILPAMGRIGELYANDPAKGLRAMRLHAQITAQDLLAVGINGNCTPLLDINYEGASLVMGDRTFGPDIGTIIALGREAIDAYLASGVYPVIKHLPGHGRVKVDPHQTLPFVDATLPELEAAEFVPFQALKDAPMGMNCHVVFRAIDDENPVSLSEKAHREVIRGTIGFDGLLFTDDLAMGAMSLPLPERAAKALAAGADILVYCTGVLDELKAFCTNRPALSPQTQARLERAQKALGKQTPIIDTQALRAELASLISP